MTESRAEFLRTQVPDLIAEVTLYPLEQGGRPIAAPPGWGCPCSIDRRSHGLFYDGWPILDDRLHPGESRRVGWLFPFADADLLKRAGKFYLWEGRFIGEAHVLGDASR